MTTPMPILPGSLVRALNPSQSVLLENGPIWSTCRGGPHGLSRSGAGQDEHWKDLPLSFVSGEYQLVHFEILETHESSPSRPKDIRIPLDTLIQPLKPSLLSHSRSLRLNTLRLLTSPLVDVPEGTSELLKKALQAEEISIDVQGARERVLRIGRLPLAVKDGDEVAAEICARWLIGTTGA